MNMGKLFKWQFEPVIRIGDIIVLCGVLIGAIVGGYILSYRVSQLEQSRAKLEERLAVLDKENTSEHLEMSKQLAATAAILNLHVNKP